jgi:hypothetical protein
MFVLLLWLCAVDTLALSHTRTHTHTHTHAASGSEAEEGLPAQSVPLTRRSTYHGTVRPASPLGEAYTASGHVSKSNVHGRSTLAGPPLAQDPLPHADMWVP